LLLVLGVLVIGFRLWWVVGHAPTYQVGQTVRVTGRIAGEPKVTNWSQIFTVGDFQVTASPTVEYHWGDRVEVIGVVIVNNTRRGIGIKAESVRFLGSAGSLAPFRLVEKAAWVYRQVLPEPQASLLLGIVWGGNWQLPSSFYQSLQNSGTMHVIAASGMNVTLVAGFIISSLVVLLPRKWAVPVGIFGIWFYVTAAGATASVVRAGIMAAAMLIAQFFGRQYEAMRFLVLVGFVMLAVNPLWLFDIGWQLSVAATAGLVMVGYRQVQAPAGWLGGMAIGDFRTSLVAILATLPIMLANFGRLSLIAPLVNALVLWTIAPLMVLGLVILFSGLIWLPLAQVVGWVTWVMLSFFIKVIEVGGGWQWAAISGLAIPWWLGVGYYLGLLWVVRKRLYNNPDHENRDY
jgi:competence protein ComEC